MVAIPQVPQQTARVDAEGHRDTFPSLLPWLLVGFAGVMATASALLWQIWTNDALRSIGIYIPIVSAVLTLQAWRRCGWETRGTWWGLLPLLYAVLMGRAGANALQIFVYSPHTSFSLLQSGLTVYAYGSGVVLLLGGARVWRKATFPLALLLLVNPVPSDFSRIDLPLQYLCAHAAQAFALAIGVHPDRNQLRLMFAPDFGMAIAPGCDGVRGAVTMGYLALILGYVYRFSVRTRVAAVLGAVALGYVFNLIRLCVLVLYYRVALSFPSWQAHGEGADYLIGGLLFLFAASLFAGVVRWKRQDEKASGAETASAARQAIAFDGVAKGLGWRGATVAVLAVIGSFSFVQSLATPARRSATSLSQTQLAAILPTQIGGYRLVRSWTEPDAQNRPTFHWGAYSAGNSQNEIDVAYWMGGGGHYPIRCHLSRGDKPLWRQVQSLPAANGKSATFELDYYQNSAPVMEASTMCDRGGCNEQVFLPSHAGIAFVGMGMSNFFFRPTSNPLPLLIREESSGSALTPDASKDAMLAQLRDFVSHLSTDAMVRFAASGNQ